eukprot:15364826-Ditylum_brightwellii.AAC.1
MRMPTNATALNSSRNQRKLKQVVLENMIWDSLTSDFQIKLMIEEKNLSLRTTSRNKLEKQVIS